jgi:hypothetical protein
MPGIEFILHPAPLHHGSSNIRAARGLRHRESRSS